MTAPTSPYTTSAAVAVLLTTPLSKKSELDNSTTPGKTATDQIISWICSQIDLQFSMAGYVVPFVAISGETWPTSQTTYLQLISTLGAAAMAGGHSLRPAPALAPGRQGGSGNVFQDLYDKELLKIYDSRTGLSMARFRASYYPATPAEKSIGTPYGPTTDWMEGYYDPSRYLGNYEIADRCFDLQMQMSAMNIQWDYIYDLIGKGYGYDVPGIERYY